MAGELIRFAVRCRAEAAERVLAELVELFPDGVEEERGGGLVEYAIYGPPGELPAIGELQAVAGDGLVEVTSSPVPPDWADRWQEFHRPVEVSGRLCIRPSWAPRTVPGAGVDVVVDPGRAFGTGAHPTTRLCLELLIELADSGQAWGPLADLGTGSGVLAIAAAKLGWAPVAGIDHEAAALEAAGRNAHASGVELELRRANLREDPIPLAETTVANLTTPLLAVLAERIAVAEPPRALVCSGLLAGEADEVENLFSRAGMAAGLHRTKGDWAAVSFARP